MTNEKTKTNSVVTASWEGAILTLKVAGAGNVVLSMDALSPTIIERAAMHGLEQRLRDRAAIARDTKTGASASPADKFARIKELADHYAAGGEWEMRGGGAGRMKEADYILQALAQVQGLEVEEMAERVATAAGKREITVDAYLKRVATSPAVAQAIAALKYGAADGGEDMLDELTDAE